MKWSHQSLIFFNENLPKPPNPPPKTSLSSLKLPAPSKTQKHLLNSLKPPNTLKTPCNPQKPLNPKKILKH